MAKALPPIPKGFAEIPESETVFSNDLPPFDNVIHDISFQKGVKYRALQALSWRTFVQFKRIEGLRRVKGQLS